MSGAVALPIRSAPGSGNDVNRLVLGGGLALLAGLLAAVALEPHNSWRMPVLVLVGVGIGAVLLRTAFGFAGAFRALIERRDASGFRAHAAMLFVATALMMPLLAMGSVFGLKLNGGETPVGIGFAVGALLFGAGMQVGGGCASGTLFSLGGGNARLIGTLAGFVIGSAIGAAHMGFWWSLPALPAATAQGLAGYGPAIAIQLAALALLWLVSGRFLPARAKGIPLLVWGGIALAVLNAATLVLSGKPWGETSAFALWGSKLITALGVDAHGWAYWQRPGFNQQLDRSLLLDTTSVMDAAILLGAAMAAAASGLFRPTLGGGGRAWLGAILGGIAMGYGARLSNGCNIGAYFSAIAAGNLSGWAWMVLALAGSWIGVQMRPLFRLGRAAPTC
ncbi:MAG TPA: YeeE/YedE family protein [Acetobacteraceae bacterium]|nr:YeeE/YedE family protein [Acetobacteraceae bacterium]